MNNTVRNGGDLEESGGERDEEGGGGPEEGPDGDDVGAVVAHGEVGGDGVAGGLYDGSEESEVTQTGGVGVERRANFLVHSRKQRLVGPLHYPRQVHQQQRHRLRLHLHSH